jgi:tetratricopeptide (TPR) repeat protein
VVAALAAPPAAFRDGVQAYNTRNYRLALTKFQQAAQVAPTDAASHYYMGLCYQGMNQYTLAQQQFQWVAVYGHFPAALLEWSMTAATALPARKTSPITFAVCRESN